PALDKLGHVKLPRRPGWNTPVRDDPAISDLASVLRSTRGVILSIEEENEAIHIATRKRRTHFAPAPGQEALCAPALGAPPRPTPSRQFRVPTCPPIPPADRGRPTAPGQE